MSLFSVLNVGARGLQVSQTGMDITGQNITSADVEGYSRKRLNLSTMYAKDSSFGQMGLGADIVNIERMRSAFLYQQIRRQNCEVGYFSEVTATFNRIETVLCEPSDLGIMQYVDQFFNSWHNLANNPSDVAARTMVRTEAQTLAEHFQRTAAELADLRQQKNDEIPMRVQRINQISIQILNLNHEIASVEIGNQNANDSRDKRDQLLNELSKLIDINVTENNLGQITVTTAGNILVAPHYVQQLETYTKEKTATVTMDDGSLRHVGIAKDIAIRFSDSKAEYNPPGGHLRGLFDSRDIYIPEYQKRIDELAIAFVNTINDIHRQGYSLDGFSGFDFFAFDGAPTGPQVKGSDGTYFIGTNQKDPNAPYLIGAASIKLSAAITSNVRNIAAATAEQSLKADKYTIEPDSYKYGNYPVQLYRDTSATDESNWVQARNITSNTVTVRTTVSNPPNPDTHYTLQEGVDYRVDYTMGTFQMLHDGFDGNEFQIEFSYNVGGFKGPGDNSNALAISELRNALSMTPNSIGDPTATFAEYYSSVVGRLGLNTNQARSNLETRVYLAEQYEAQQDMIAGVSLDEEMANLIRFQHTYTAAARLITTVDKMIETLLNM